MLKTTTVIKQNPSGPHIYLFILSTVFVLCHQLLHQDSHFQASVVCSLDKKQTTDEHT